MRAGAFERGQRAALRAVLCLFTTRVACSREMLAQPLGALRAEYEAIARGDEQVTAALRAVLGPEADRDLASLPAKEREAVRLLWQRLSEDMREAAPAAHTPERSR